MVSPVEIWSCVRHCDDCSCRCFAGTQVHTERDDERAALDESRERHPRHIKNRGAALTYDSFASLTDSRFTPAGAMQLANWVFAKREALVCFHSQEDALKLALVFLVPHDSPILFEAEGWCGVPSG